MFSADDISALLDDELTVDASYTPAGGQASTVKVIFDKKYQVAVDLAGFAGVGTSGPAVTGKTTDFASAKSGDTIVISAVTYYIKTVEADGTGLTVMELSRDSA